MYRESQFWLTSQHQRVELMKNFRTYSIFQDELCIPCHFKNSLPEQNYQRYNSLQELLVREMSNNFLHFKQENGYNFTFIVDILLL